MKNKVQIVSNIEIETEKKDRIDMNLKEVYDLYLKDVPQSVLDEIFNDNHVDYVAENLKSHNRESLMKRIQDLFQPYILGFGANCKLGDLDQFYILFKPEVDVVKISEDQNLKNLLLFYNYFITKVVSNEGNGNIRQEIRVEPTFPKKIENVSSVCYHFTNKEHVDKILKNGLRCKLPKGSYRFYPERIYLFNPSRFSLFKENPNFLKNFISLIKGIKTVEKARKELSIIKVDFNCLCQRNLDFYQDVTLSEVYPSIFTYNNIPSECLTDVTSDKLWNHIYSD